jgi:hypothetical protein
MFIIIIIIIIVIQNTCLDLLLTNNNGLHRKVDFCKIFLWSGAVIPHNTSSNTLEWKMPKYLYVRYV